MGSPKDDADQAGLPVEVVYALPDHQTVLPLLVPDGTSVMDAVRRSGILRLHPEIDPETNRLGIHGVLVEGEQVLRARDRIEIYRPLIADPKEVRRQRARAR